MAALAAAKGYKCILTMPSSMSIERSKLAEAYGAEVIRTTENALQGAVDKAVELSKKKDTLCLINFQTQQMSKLTTKQQV